MLAAMDVASRIRERGFRKWYERQLIESHLAFVTCFLCGITAAACMSAVRWTRLAGTDLALTLALFGAGLLGWQSWRRYITVLERAELYGNRSTCPQCGVYARFEVLASGSRAEGSYLDPAADPLPTPWLQVRCRRCSTEWRMPE